MRRRTLPATPGPAMSPPFIGRTKELDLVRGELPESTGAEGRFIAISGSPGIGKTCFMAEIGRQAEAPGLHVLWSQMIEEPAVPPYFAWLLLLRAAIQCCSGEVLAADAGSGAVHLADLVPELRDRLELPSAHGPSGARSRFQLFDAVTRFLLAAAQRRPLVLLFDNLHLADRSSIEMLELLPAHPGKSGRGGRRRLRAKRRQPPVRGRSRRRAGAAHPAGFFSAATPRFKVPQTLGALIATRLESLPAETIGLLDIPAVLGRDFGAGALAHHSLCNDIMTVLEPAEAAGIVALLGTRRFRFHHALFREVPTCKLITWTCPVRTCRPLPTWNSHWEVRLHPLDPRASGCGADEIGILWCRDRARRGRRRNDG